MDKTGFRFCKENGKHICSIALTIKAPDRNHNIPLFQLHSSMIRVKLSSSMGDKNLNSNSKCPSEIHSIVILLDCSKKNSLSAALHILFSFPSCLLPTFLSQTSFLMTLKSMKSHGSSSPTLPYLLLYVLYCRHLTWAKPLPMPGSSDKFPLATRFL